MKKSIAAARRLDAERSITASAGKLADRFGVQPPLIITVQDPASRSVLQLEAIANFLERLSVAGSWGELEAVIVQRLVAAGYGSPASVISADDGELLRIEGIGPATLKRIREVLA